MKTHERWNLVASRRQRVHFTGIPVKGGWPLWTDGAASRLASGASVVAVQLPGGKRVLATIKNSLGPRGQIYGRATLDPSTAEWRYRIYLPIDRKGAA